MGTLYSGTFSTASATVLIGVVDIGWALGDNLGQCVKNTIPKALDSLPSVLDKECANVIG